MVLQTGGEKPIYNAYLSLLLTRSHVIFSIILLSSNPTTVAAIRGASGAGAGCSLIGSEHTTSLVPYNCKINMLHHNKSALRQLLAFSYLLAEKFSFSAMFTKKEFAVVSNLRFISRTIFMLSRVEFEKSFITSGPDLFIPHLVFTH